MCAVCVNCGKCEGNPRPKLQPGMCVYCWHDNGPGATHCARCGKPIPMPPGSPCTEPGGVSGCLED